MKLNFAFGAHFALLLSTQIVSAQPMHCEVKRVVLDCSPLSSSIDCKRMDILSDKIGVINGVEINSTVEECDTTVTILTGGVCFDARYELRGPDGKKYQIGARFRCR